MIKTAIIYNHRGRFSKDGNAPVEIRVTQDRRSYYINTGVSVRAREWKFGQIVNRGDADALNERVRIMLERVDRIVNEKMQEGSEADINIEEVRKRVFAPDNRKKVDDAEDMLAWMADEVGRLGVKKGTAAHYRVSVAVFIESGIMRK